MAAMSANGSDIVNEGGRFDSVRIQDGDTFVNMDFMSEVGILDMNGGIFDNAGSIDDMIYKAGTFNGANGSIVALTLAGDAGGNDFGKVTSLSFDPSGSGFLTLNGFAPFAVANSVDLSFANLTWDLTNVDVADWWAGIKEQGGYSFRDLFGGASVNGDFATFTLVTAYGNYSFDDLAAKGFLFADGAFTWSEVPEPATLAIIGLGLAGLGLARRRMRK
jgi:hypothetical protein